MDSVPEGVDARIAQLEGYIADRDKTVAFARGFAKDLSGQIDKLKDKLSRAEMALHIAEEDAGNALGRCAELQTKVTELEAELKTGKGLVDIIRGGEGAVATFALVDWANGTLPELSSES